MVDLAPLFELCLISLFCKLFVYPTYVLNGFQGRFLFKTDNEKKRAKKMGIKDFSKKYDLNEIVSGDSIFCATGITNSELVSGIKLYENEFISETLVTHKSSGLKKAIKLKQKI